jgi:RimJ/RimL family protein N-acetyltransferase
MQRFPEIHTGRLTLRRVEAGDIGSLLKYANSKSISGNILNMSYPYREEDAVAWVNRAMQGYRSGERFILAIVLKEIGEFIGAIALNIDARHNVAELGYWLGEPFRGRGIMSEAAKAMLKFGFEELDLHKIFATAFIENKASEKILLNNGMIREGEMKDHYKVDDVYKSVAQYRLTKDEYEKLV